MPNKTVSPKKAYALRTCRHDMTSRNGFVWPREGLVECPDWDPTPERGNGLHGLLNGQGDGGYLSWDESAVWQVVEIEEWVDLGNKVKFPRGVVVHTGDQVSATEFLKEKGFNQGVVGQTVTGGHRSTVTGGDYSTVTGGSYSTVTGWDDSTVTGGDDSTVTGGDNSTVTGGDYSTITGGYRSTGTGGHRSTVTGGYGSTVTGGDYSTAIGGDYSTVTGGYCSTVTGGVRSTVTGDMESVLSLHHYDGYRARVVTAYVGEDGILPNVAYKLNGAGEFVRAKGDQND